MSFSDFLVVIPARLESTRLPNKPLIEINGKTLIQRTCEQVNKAIPTKNFIVATDNLSIFRHVKNLGFNAEITSSECLTGTDRIAEIAKKHSYSHYINVQGDEPIINPKDILKAISSIENFPNDVLNGYSNIKNQEDYYSLTIPKVVFDQNKKLLYMSRSPIPGNKEGSFKKSWKQVCIYVYPKKALLAFNNLKTKTPLENQEDIEVLRFIEIGFQVRMIEMSSDSISIDVPSDINKLKEILSNE